MSLHSSGIGPSRPMPVGLYDDPRTMRRVMWVKSPKGQPLLYGWCHALVLHLAGELWDAACPFGHFPPPTT